MCHAHTVALNVLNEVYNQFVTDVDWNYYCHPIPCRTVDKPFFQAGELDNELDKWQ